MSRRYTFLIVSVVIILAAILLVPSFIARGLTALVLLLAAFVLLVRAFTHKSSSILVTSEAEERNGNTSDEIFALGKLFEATTGGMREGLLVVDRDLRVVASNPAAHRLFSLSEKNSASQRLTELTRNRAIYSAFLDALKGKERSGVKVETHSPERRIFDLRVVPLGSTDGGVTEGAIGIFFDVTRLERLERIRQEFLSNVSHELRTPLTAILAFVETLEGGAINDSENSERFLSIIRRNASRMQHLIDDILELSAIEAGNINVEPRDVALYPMVNDVITALTTKASGRGIVLTNAVAQEATVYADGRRLEQMITNLVDNGIKFNREGGSVKVWYENGVRDGIFVEDTGEGIPSQHLERLFERFYRVDRARSRDMGGTGLGLAIVKHLARAHGGEVTVKSTLGEGSRFMIELPKAAKAGRKDEG